MAQEHGERRNFNGDCCPSMVEMKARYADHTVGADGVNHRTISDQMKRNDEQHVEILQMLTEFRDEISAKFDTVQRRQWYMSGALAVIVGALTWLGPSGLKQMVTMVEAIFTGGWNG